MLYSFRNYSWFWVPVVAPHVGAILGAFIYQYAVGLHWPPDNIDSPLKLSETNINPGKLFSYCIYLSIYFTFCQVHTFVLTYVRACVTVCTYLCV